MSALAYAATAFFTIASAGCFILWKWIGPAIERALMEQGR